MYVAVQEKLKGPRFSEFPCRLDKKPDFHGFDALRSSLFLSSTILAEPSESAGYRRFKLGEGS